MGFAQVLNQVRDLKPGRFFLHTWGVLVASGGFHLAALGTLLKAQLPVT